MIFKFLGSLYFAILLIVFTLLFVIAGTVLESLQDSHLYAARFTYHNPVFQLLLWLYFINILFSAVSRFPFKKKHIPFLLTHLGLLLLLMGVFIKNHFGTQGTLLLPEGSASSQILLPNSFALQIESPETKTWIGIKKNQLGPLSNSLVQLTILEWTPHVEEHYEGFIKDGWGHVIGLPPFELEKPLLTTHYTLYATQTDNLDTLVFPGHAALYLIKDPDNQEHIVAYTEQAERFSTPIHSDTFLIYNKGYGGYALFAELPPHFPQLELITPLTRKFISKPLPQKREELTPKIRLLVEEGDQKEVITLSYDRYSQKFKWPILGGKYLIRFQSNTKNIPVHLRLKSAKQINYPESNQPYSYEAKVLIDEKEATLNMNHVYEKQGYRFYLSNLSSSELGANHVQIVVNHDPAKYILTYPGSILLALGILLLYFQKRYV